MSNSKTTYQADESSGFGEAADAKHREACAYAATVLKGFEDDDDSDEAMDRAAAEYTAWLASR